MSDLETGVMAVIANPSPERVLELEADLLQRPQVDLQTTHHLAGGVYARTIFIPAGVALTGAAHKVDHINIMCGDIMVSTDQGMQRLTGHQVFTAKAGSKRVGRAYSDTTWTSVFHTDLTSIEEVENELVYEPETLQTRSTLLGCLQTLLKE
jgi:hypothetical protein